MTATDSVELAERVAAAIVKDICARSGGDAFWYGIDEGIRNTIIQDWQEIVELAVFNLHAEEE